MAPPHILERSKALFWFAASACLFSYGALYLASKEFPGHSLSFALIALASAAAEIAALIASLGSAGLAAYGWARTRTMPWWLFPSIVVTAASGYMLLPLVIRPK